MIYTDSHGVRVSFHPWLSGGYRLISLSLEESLGGIPAGGVIHLVGSPSSQEFHDLREKECTGELLIEKPGFYRIESSVFIIDKKFKNQNLVVSFICTSDPKYSRDKVKMSYEGTLPDILKQVYPDLILSCDSDVTTPLKFHQNNITNFEFLGQIASGYRNRSTYGFTWDGKFMIREIYDNENSEKLGAIITQGKQQSSSYEKVYNPEIYGDAFNAWEEPEKNGLGKDYKDLQPIYLRSLQRRGSASCMMTDYYQLYLNSMVNQRLLGSNLFQNLSFTFTEGFPKVYLGDTIRYFRAEILNGKTYTWPYTLYVVSKNVLGIAAEGSGQTVVDKSSFAFTSYLLGLEEEGKVALEKTEEEDPTKTEEDKDSGHIRDDNGSSSSGPPKIS